MMIYERANEEMTLSRFPFIYNDKTSFSCSHLFLVQGPNALIVIRAFVLSVLNLNSSLSNFLLVGLF
jgi:hypothetical protein